MLQICGDFHLGCPSIRLDLRRKKPLSNPETPFKLPLYLIFKPMEIPKELSPLSQLEEILKKENREVFLMTPTEKGATERLFISLGQDKKARDYVLQLCFVNDLAKASGMSEEPEDAILLQFLAALPFQTKAECASEVSRLLFSVNRILPLGAFGFDEKAGIVYFQYVLVSDVREITEKVFKEVISMTEFAIDTFCLTIEAAGEGQKDYDQLLEELKEKGFEFSPDAQVKQSTQQIRP